MLHIESTLTHHLFHIAVGKLKATVPSDAEQDDLRGMMAPLEGRGDAVHEQSRQERLREREEGIIPETLFCNTDLVGEPRPSKQKTLAVRLKESNERGPQSDAPAETRQDHVILADDSAPAAAKSSAIIGRSHHVLTPCGEVSEVEEEGFWRNCEALSY